MKNIVLIGMSGVGKTTIGKALSRALDRQSLDTDSLVERQTGINIENIFSMHGEVYFRHLESDVIDELFQRKNLIISTGGGIVLDSNNIKKLKENGIIILLESSLDNIVSNIKKSKTVRPLLNSEEDIFEKVRAMYNERKKLYFLYADFIVSVDNKSIDEIVYEILGSCVKINS